MQLNSFPLSCGTEELFLDRVEVDPCGIIRLSGWSTFSKLNCCPEIHLDGESIPFLQHYRVARPDVDVSWLLQAGVVFEYLVPESFSGRQFESVSVAVNGLPEFRFEGAFEFLNPHYRVLFASSDIYRREALYASGLPNSTVHPEILALAKKLESPILDFGCGSGALVHELQKLGHEAHGLELDNERIRQSIPPALRGSVTLYDGRFPSQFISRSFRSVFCSEVLEHIPYLQSAVREIARLTSWQAVFTVPDASAIPIGFRHALVPWHLLEGSHVNFFNQKSLESLLQPYFSRIEFGRVCRCTFNDSPFYVSLTASCWK